MRSQGLSRNKPHEVHAHQTELFGMFVPKKSPYLTVFESSVDSCRYYCELVLRDVLALLEFGIRVSISGNVLATVFNPYLIGFFVYLRMTK